MIKLKEFLLLNTGIILTAAGIHIFRNTNNFALGGITGLGLLFSEIMPQISISAYVFVLGTLSLLIGFICMGWEFTKKSLYGTYMLSAVLWVLEVVFPMSGPLTNQKLLELIFSVLIPGFGSALIFYSGATTGGIEIIAKIIDKYFHIRFTTCLFVINFLIAASTGFIFGIEACLYSVLGVASYSFVVNGVIENLKVHKIVTIITLKGDLIKEFICKELEMGATIHEAKGAFTFEKKEVITTVLSRKQALQLQLFLRKIDPGAFITITNSTQIIGGGFGGYV